MTSGVPPLPGYFNTVESMDRDQRRFYRSLEPRLRAGLHTPVDGQVGYVFAFLYGCLAKWNRSGYESLYDYLTLVSEVYSEEPKLSDYCLHWAADCLLGREQYETYLERTQPRTVTRAHTHLSNLRLNIQQHLELAPDAADIVTMLKPRSSKVIRAHEGAFRTHLSDVLQEHAEEAGADWYQLLLRDNYGEGTYAHSLFQGAPLARNPKLAIDLRSFYSTHEGVKLIANLTKKAENRLREGLKLPLVGQGWVSETRLYRTIADAFPETQVVQHGQPPWLGRQHLDVWIPSWGVAVEYHGRQHFEPVEFFGGQAAFEATQQRDTRKLNLCRRHGVKLIVATEAEPDQEVIDAIAAHRQRLRRTLPK